MNEKGLSDKWTESGLQMAYDNIYDNTFNHKPPEKRMEIELDEMNIIFGPYLLGICLAVLVLIIENIIQFKCNQNIKKIK